MRFEKNLGFTLVEVVIAVAIIGILSATSLLAYQNYTNRTRIGTCHSEAATYVKNRAAALTIEIKEVDLPSYISSACASAADVSPLTLGKATLEATFTAKDTANTVITCSWGTLSCALP